MLELFEMLLKALAYKNSFETSLFFTDKEDVSIQHLDRVIWGLQLVYNILFRLDMKISVSTAKSRDSLVVSEVSELSATKRNII